jgi:Asp-tRNA(Asn)/Glu-tRNA(Gln) amidotransferase B subunit
VSLQAAKKVFLERGPDGADPLAVAERLGLLQVRDESALETWVDEVLAAHPQEVQRYRAGEAKLLGFLTGQVMRRSQGKADPKGVQPVLVRKLGAT